MTQTSFSPEETAPLTNQVALRNALLAHGIELSTWGSGDAKSLDHLWDEIATGESQLIHNPLCRVLSGVVQVIIHREDGRMLIEAEQIFHDGRRRDRNLPPSEKMLPGENVFEAARRCLTEELGLPPTQYDILEDEYDCHETVNTSWSYPGLLSKYTIHRVFVSTHSLPRDSFWTEESDESSDNLVTHHRWDWQFHSSSVV